MELLRARWVECRLVGYRRDYAAIVTPLTSAQVVNASPRADPNLSQCLGRGWREKRLAI
jgi:hypothetical protein